MKKCVNPLVYKRQREREREQKLRIFSPRRSNGANSISNTSHFVHNCLTEDYFSKNFFFLFRGLDFHKNIFFSRLRSIEK